MTFRLLSRPGCHLCEDLATELTSLGIEFDTVDIDTDDDLIRRYGFEIPVLFLGDTEIIRAPVAPSALRTALAGAGVAVAGH